MHSRSTAAVPKAVHGGADEGKIPPMLAMKKKVCLVLVVDDLGYGGAERQVAELANNLDSEHFDVHVCTLSDHVPLGSTLRNPEQRLHTIIRKSRFDFTVVPRLVRLLRALEADIVHGFLFSAEIASRLAGRIAGTRLVVGSERNANKPAGKIQKLAYTLTWPCVDFVIANSSAGALFNARQFRRPSSEYRVVYNGVDTERFRPSDGRLARRNLGIPWSCPVAGVFAAFKEQKNHPMLLRAFQRVLGSSPEARLLIVGDEPVDGKRRSNGYKTRVHRLVDDLGIHDRCLFLGHQKDVERLYPVCDVTVLSSFHEGTPNVLLESMACGVPVVATNVCDNGYVVREGEVGYLVALGDEEAMAERIQSLLGDTVRRQEMGQKARRWVLDEFSTARLAEKMGAVYMELLRLKVAS